jgi:hypothetical protein
MVWRRGSRAGSCCTFSTRAAPAVDRLVVVADHEHAARCRRPAGAEGVLDGVGVLELVDQHVAKRCGSAPANVGVVAQQFVRAQQQFGEIDQPGAFAGRW